jgi:hypothetical protein
MSPSSVRVQCPRCKQRLRVLFAADHKTSVSCPLCDAKIPLKEKVYKVGPPLADTDIHHQQDSTLRFYELQEEPEPVYRSSWTLGKTIRLALSLGPFFFAFLGFAPMLRALSRFLNAPSPVLGVLFAIAFCVWVFWLGLGLWLANVAETMDWEPIARLLCFGGLGVGVMTVVGGLLAGSGDEMSRLWQ